VCTSFESIVLQYKVQTGVWLTAEEVEISKTPWALGLVAWEGLCVYVTSCWFTHFVIQQLFNLLLNSDCLLCYIASVDTSAPKYWLARKKGKFFIVQ